MPEKWVNMKKLTMQAKLKIAPLQALESDNIQRKAKKFETEQYDFREIFTKKSPFSSKIINPYEVLDEVKN